MKSPSKPMAKTSKQLESVTQVVLLDRVQRVPHWLE